LIDWEQTPTNDVSTALGWRWLLAEAGAVLHVQMMERLRLMVESVLGERNLVLQEMERTMQEKDRTMQEMQGRMEWELRDAYRRWLVASRMMSPHGLIGKLVASEANCTTLATCSWPCRRGAGTRSA
jgi:hypothetical protein